MKKKIVSLMLVTLMILGFSASSLASLENTGYKKAEAAFKAAKQGNPDLAHKLWLEERDIWKRMNWNTNPMFEQYYISAQRKADFIRNEVRVFVERPSSTLGDKYYHGAKFEPKTGCYLGLFGEGDPGIHDKLGTGTRETYDTGGERITGRKYAQFLLYYHWGMDFSHYQTHFDRIKGTNTSMMIALEPSHGLDAVKDDEYLRKFIRDMGNSEVPMFLRFANEMNDPSNPWHKDGPEKYKEKFKLVAKIVKEEAPNVALVWSPNDYPPTQVDIYYPGDQYVDWVGVSTYASYEPGLDPIRQGVDRASYIDQMRYVYETYGDRKPIMITEGAASAVGIKSHENTSNLASDQIKEFYSYLPRLYPNVKASIYWDSSQDDRNTNGNYRNYILTQHPNILNAYKTAISDPYFLSNIGESSKVSYSDVTTSGLKAGKEKISAFVKTWRPGIGRIDYLVNGKKLASSTSVPYEVDIDFSDYAGENINIFVNAYDYKGSLISSKSQGTWVVGELRNPSKDNPFTDMKDSDWFVPAVKYVYKNGYFAGTSKDKFEPSTHMNRSMLVQTLYNLENKPRVSWSEKFKDVESGKWYSDAIIWAEEEGIVSGYDNGKFGTNDKITREQISVMLYKYAQMKGEDVTSNLDLGSFEDSDKISNWAIDSMIWANSEKIINGRTSTSLAPKGNASRGEVATMIMNLMKR